jgi:hypothetical protein
MHLGADFPFMNEKILELVKIVAFQAFEKRILKKLLDAGTPEKITATPPPPCPLIDGGF